MSTRNRILEATYGIAHLLPDAHLRADTARPLAAGVSAPVRDLVAIEWEAARQRNATERGYAYVAPNCTSDREQSSRLQSGTSCLRTDGELAKMCAIGFKHYAQYQRWLPLHDLARRTGQQGFTFTELMDTCQRLGIKGCETYTRRVIRKGIGFYWNYDPTTDKIYPTSYTELCKRAIQYAYDLGLHDLYLHGNHPGQRRDMYLSVAGSGADFEASVLAAWYASHGNPTLSRYTLTALLARDVRSIRRMEKRVGIRIIFNEAQTTDPAAVPLKADGTPRGDVRYEQGVWTSRLPNTYVTAHAVRQHPAKGQGRKAACWFKQWLSSDRLPGRPQANVAESDMGKLNSIGRTYCENSKTLKASRKRGHTGVLYQATMGVNKGRVWKVDAVYEDI